MKASHWIPGIIISFAMICLGMYTLRDINEESIDMPEDTNRQNAATYCSCLNWLLLRMAIVWASVGVFVAIIYLIQMISFVDVRGPGQGHVSVPTVCVVIQCGMLITSMCLGFYSKWLHLRTATQDEDHLA